MFFLHIKSFFAVFWVHECVFNLVYLIVTIIRIIISTCTCIHLSLIPCVVASVCYAVAGAVYFYILFV